MTAFFRQTMWRIRAFREEGCLSVNNEVSSCFAVCTARDVEAASLLVVGDILADGTFRIPDDTPPSREEATLDITLQVLVNRKA